MYFPSINILRGFAAISVVIYHVIFYWNWQAFPENGPLSWFRIGWLGVDLFFVISGFVIGLSAFTEIDRHGAQSFRGPFWRRRIARIVPLYYLTCLVYIVFISPELLFHKFWPNLIAHVFFIHNTIIQWHGAINGVNWSLGAEMQFYVLMLLLAPWLREGRTLVIATVLIGVTWAWRLGSWYIMQPQDHETAFALWRVATQLPGMLDEFLAGLLLARFVRSTTGQAFIGKVRANFALFALLLSIFSALLWATLYYYWEYPVFWFYPSMVTFFRTPLALAWALLIFLACCANSPPWLRLTSPLQYLGEVSYGIYLWHLPVILSLKRIPTLSPSKALLITFGLSLLFAAISWHFFEKPLIERFGRVRQKESTA